MGTRLLKKKLKNKHTRTYLVVSAYSRKTATGSNSILLLQASYSLVFFRRYTDKKTHTHFDWYLDCTWYITVCTPSTTAWHSLTHRPICQKSLSAMLVKCALHTSND